MKKLSHFLSFVLIAAFLLVVGIAVHDVFFPDDQLLLSAILNGSSSREPSSVCDGIDVSHHQGLIDWEAVSATKVQFVFLKATEGATHVDRRFARNLRGARRVGIPVGAYHFLNAKSTIASQFANFYEHASPSELDLLPVVDVEWSGVRGWSTQQLHDSLSLFVRLVEEYYGCQPLIYADEKFFYRHLKGHFDSYPLFIARYQKQQPQLPFARRYYLWQSSEKGHVAGISGHVDLDMFTPGTTIEDIRGPHPVPPQ